MRITDFVLLLIEDDPEDVRHVQEAMGRAHLVNPLQIVRDGPQAIAYLSGQDEYADRGSYPMPSLILLDETLPGTSGLELLEWIRSRPFLKGIPVVLLTASPQDEKVEQAYALGASFHLTKPVESAGLLLMMKSIGSYWMILDKTPETSRRAPAAAIPSDSGTPVPVSSDRPLVAAGRRPESRPMESSVRCRDTDILGPRIKFRNTSWDLVRGARNVDTLDALIRIYWKPLYFFVRQRGYDNEEAKDLVQEFLTHAFEQGMIPKADPARGRFRTFLLAALNNFLKDQHRLSKRQKRGGGHSLVSLDLQGVGSGSSLAVPREEAPESGIDRAWAMTLLDGCLSGLQGKPSHLRAFELHRQGVDYETISGETGLSKTAAKTAVHRLRTRLASLLRARLGTQTETGVEAGQEVADFASLLRPNGS